MTPRCFLAAGLLCCLAALPAAAQTGSPPLPPEIAARKTLTIALFAAFPPMAYKVPETNTLTGARFALAGLPGLLAKYDLVLE